MSENLNTFENIRRNNLIWTISNNYNFLPNYSIFEFGSDEKINFYKSALSGFSYMKFQMNEIYSFLNILINDNPKPEDYYKVTELILEEYFWNYYEKYRPGILEYRNYTVKTKFDYYKFRQPTNLTEELEYAFYSRKLKQVPKTREMTILLLNDIMNLKDIKNSSDLILKLKNIIKNHFYLNLDLKYKQKIDKIVEKANEKELEKSQNKPKLEFNSKGDTKVDEEVEAAEFNKINLLSEDMNKNNDEKDENYSKNIYSKELYTKDLAEKVYGKSILNKVNNLKLENKLCTGYHDGIKILITKGEFGNTPNEQFRISEQEFNKKENLKHFEKNFLIYKRSITKLKDTIQKEILADLEESSTLSGSGKLIPSYLWKPKYLHNNKIFLKELKDEIGTVSVDILLDSSASQIERQEIVASQGYVIAQALTELNIPTRVMSFNNFYNVLVLRLFRDYNDTQNKNQNIFEYSASGSNRDGLAIKTINHLMKNSPVDRKILIVLSDGKPYDKINIKIIGNLKQKAVDYVKEEAVRDTAKEVFLGRNSGNTILGVFTGETKDLPSEKKIYGQDFAYISNITRFSDIVGNFLKNVFKNGLNY
ncbi:hypothetical protein [Miniphocaeibacter massiliensis]|uniref:hypothetical protein n=1 Tax=Miniphocaeibacter massiliensis TaxID=2041841 RepID=UPI000C07E9B4|nr:hypothetical protein [Miniphocaeibacter massiliensis]